ncbi:flagellin [Halodesulfovibrio spirochaetisodalis]|uniref:flagellin n=1 Tax=Halodesulfovibrio spirochaetisodalis TaxID=1560234 RepID=UPI002F90F09C
MDAEGVVKFGKTAAAGTATYVSRSGLATVVNTFDNVAGTGEIDTKTGEVKNLTGTALTTSTMADVAYTGTEKGKVVAEQWNAGTNKWDDVTASLTTTAANFGGSVRISVEQADGSVLRETFSEHTSNFQLSINAAGTTVTVGDGTVDSTAAIQIKSEVAASKTFEHTAKSGITVTTDAVTYYEDNSATLAGAKAELSHNARTGEISGDDLKAVESTLKNSYGTEKTPVSDFKIETYDEASNTWQEVALGANTGDTVNILDDAKKFRITAEYGDGKKVRDTISENSGGRFTITKTDHGLSIDMMTGVNAQKSSTQLKVESEDLVVVNVHFGSSSSKTDGYDTEINMATAKSLGVGQEAGDNILTQENAKKALENLTIAISKKDAIRAQIGSTQNRLSATIENISIQKENLKSAESRISDVNVATEMTEFNKQQILANAAVSMLAQANNLPKMAQKLLG